MADRSTIEWTDATWNPIVGCSIVSTGCTNCYAMKMAARIEAMAAGAGRASQYEGTTEPSKAGPVWTGKVALAPDHVLIQPLRWKRPRRIFVNSMGDLFHEDIPDLWIDRVFAVMALCAYAPRSVRSPTARGPGQHTFQILTKRPERMREYASNPSTPARISDKIGQMAHDGRVSWRQAETAAALPIDAWPLPNVWLGVSAERQAEADERIPHLLNTPAAVRFVSAEPLLGPIDLTRLCLLPKKPGSERAGIHIDALAGRYCESCMVYTGDWDINAPPPPNSDRRALGWIIAGGESGPNARPMHPDWARSLRNQCSQAGVPYFFKQFGEWMPISPGEWEGEPGAVGSRFIPERQPGDIWMRNDGLIGNGKGDTSRPPRIWNPAEMVIMRKVGKHRAGNLLDGRQHLEWPESTPSEAAGYARAEPEQ